MNSTHARPWWARSSRRRATAVATHHGKSDRPWWAAASSADRVTQPVRSVFAAVVSTAAVAVVGVSTLSAIAHSSPPPEMQRSSSSATVVWSATVNDIDHGCTPTVEVLDSSLPDAVLPKPYTKDRSPTPPGAVGIATRGLMAPQPLPDTPTDDPVNLFEVVRSLWNGDMVVLYDPNVDDDALTVASDVVASSDLPVNLYPWPGNSDTAGFTDTRSFALVGWGHLQYCGDVALSVLTDFYDRLTPPGTQGATPPRSTVVWPKTSTSTDEVT